MSTSQFTEPVNTWQRDTAYVLKNLELGNYHALSRWFQCNLKHPYEGKRKARVREGDVTTESRIKGRDTLAVTEDKRKGP